MSPAVDQRSAVWPHFFVVSNLQGRLREWTKFKDFIRAMLPRNQPGWTDTGPQSLPPYNCYYAIFSVKTIEDAHHAYRGLTSYSDNGHRLLVHRFDVSHSQAQLLECNCSSFYGLTGHSTQSHAMEQLCSRLPSCVPVSAPMVSSPYSGAPPISAVAPTYAYATADVYATPQPQVVSSPIHAVVDGFTGLSIGQMTYPGTHYYQQPVMLAPVASAPIYTRNSHGLPVNMSNGAVRTEIREIHIGNLSYSIGRRELERLLKKAGSSPTSFDIHQDAAGNSKGSAVAYFASEEEARRAVEHLKGFQIKNKKLRVRLGVNQTPVDMAGAPVIVNGSTQY
ncbi:hypothetical protein EJ06DRAFT_61053 [Trichodelitschia bisporula]|uniref:RRM domain-containing protein n=1 Tax=Trichodelitschia bisporula TaxID=703511 RepID=A0A6G1HUY3_9PEZI|nr:hypothetical protein EJ06DRAFT_61053 [Trichodelitschia bisporula]